MSSSAHDRLTAALLQGGMPRLFVPGVLDLFDTLVNEALAQPRRLITVGGVLTPREREWLRLRADGATTNETVRIMNVAPSTVKTHADGALAKLYALSTPHAVAQGLRAGVIQ